jgi:hypothetical protein
LLLRGCRCDQTGRGRGRGLFADSDAKKNHRIRGRRADREITFLSRSFRSRSSPAATITPAALHTPTRVCARAGGGGPNGEKLSSEKMTTARALKKKKKKKKR